MDTTTQTITDSTLTMAQFVAFSFGGTAGVMALAGAFSIAQRLFDMFSSDDGPPLPDVIQSIMENELQNIELEKSLDDFIVDYKWFCHKYKRYNHKWKDRSDAELSKDEESDLQHTKLDLDDSLGLDSPFLRYLQWLTHPDIEERAFKVWMFGATVHISLLKFRLLLDEKILENSSLEDLVIVLEEYIQRANDHYTKHLATLRQTALGPLTKQGDDLAKSVTQAADAVIEDLFDQYLAGPIESGVDERWREDHPDPKLVKAYEVLVASGIDRIKLLSHLKSRAEKLKSLEEADPEVAKTKGEEKERLSKVLKYCLDTQQIQKFVKEGWVERCHEVDKRKELITKSYRMPSNYVNELTVTKQHHPEDRIFVPDPNPTHEHVWIWDDFGCCTGIYEGMPFFYSREYGASGMWGEDHRPTADRERIARMNALDNEWDTRSKLSETLNLWRKMHKDYVELYNYHRDQMEKRNDKRFPRVDAKYDEYLDPLPPITFDMERIESEYFEVGSAH